MRAVRDFGCGFALVIQDVGKFNLPLTPLKPAIVVIGDDLVTSKGPAAFHAESIVRVIRQCESAFIISSGAEETTYAAACFAPIQLRKHSILAHGSQWADFINEVNPGIRMVISKVDPLARPEPQQWGRA